MPGVDGRAVPGVAVELPGVAVEPFGVAVVCAIAKLPASIIPPITISFVFIELPPNKQSVFPKGRQGKEMLTSGRDRNPQKLSV